MGSSANMSTNNTYIKYSIEIAQNSQSTANNTSNVTVDVWIWRTNTGYTTYGTGSCYCKIDGTTYSSSISSSQKITSDPINLFSKTLNISHNSDGSKTLTCSAWISMDVVSSSEQSYSQGLTTIGRASSFSGGSGNIGSSTTITISRASSSFTHILYYQFGSSDWVTIASGVGTSYSWTIPTSFYSRVPNSNSGTGTLWCETYNGSSYIGSYSISFTFYVTNSNPTFSSSQISYQDTNSTVAAITGNNQQIVRNQSSLQISFTSATARNSASMSSYQITFNGSTTTRTSSGSISYGIVNSGNNLSVSIKAIDSRGNSTTASKTITFLDWSSPTATITANRKNNFETETYLKANTLISSVNGKNSLQTLQYRNKKSSDSSYGNWIDLPNNTQITISIDNTVAWNFQIQLSDKFGSNSYSFTLAKGQPIMFFDTDKISVGVNTFPDRSNYLQASNIESMGIIRNSSSNTGTNYIYGSTYFNSSGSTVYFQGSISLSTAAKQYISQFIYPVGAIYMSISSTNPSSLFGGSWSLWGSGRVPVCINTSDSDFSSSEKTGGSKTVSLSTSQMPSHTHTIYQQRGSDQIAFGGHYSATGGNNIYNTAIRGTTNDETTNILKATSTGSGSSHTNLQPYITCYMWKRTG
ncbi:MAG: DUF859 family phage minor structural protein [Oscillospiraceae bacterium]|jgi:hypothetical protein|nr:DUF859 family phage minor structural protein [Oscillospiraceae bacterium]